MDPSNINMTSPQTPTSPLEAPTSPLLHRRSSSRSSTKSSLTLDLSKIPPLTQPTPPTNTLLITNLNDVGIFRPDNLQTIRDLISQTAPIVTWAPLKSFRRIVVSFADENAAVRVRSVWDGEAVLGERCRVYFGQHTPLDLASRGTQRLDLPDAGKLFFISPPPSPPHGWESKVEDAPNKQVHAEDLADALARLHHHSSPTQGMNHQQAMMVDVSPVSPTGAASIPTRSRSSTLIYQPEEHGEKAGLPAISVDDMTDSPAPLSPTMAAAAAASEKPIMAHTSRPPVELMMEDA